MTAKELRQKFLDFFKSKGHTIISSASLIPPETDPTALFTTAGMHPLVPYLLGEDHPGGKRVANIQKCIRTSDIDEVGDESHLTFFEMMGNWSFGDPASPDGIGAAGYFKKEAIEWSWEFLTDKKWLGIDSERITITVFKGDKDAPRDEESAGIWKSLGIPENKIGYKNKKENWWGPAGATGPCGPDTEMFIDGVEVWNDVFMEYDRKVKSQKSKVKSNEVDYEYVKLKQKNVDTGMGLERIAMIMQGKKSVYETDLFAPIVAKIKKLSVVSGQLSVVSERIIADHIKASVFIIADGVVPSNVGRGYVVRRLVRRAVRYGKLLGIEKNFTKDIAEAVVDIYKDSYPEVKEKEKFIYEELEKEENKFRKTLEKGMKKLEGYSGVDSSSIHEKNGYSGYSGFDIYQTYGFPPELTKEILKEKQKKISDKFDEQFEEKLEEHKKLSQTASAGQFKGGLAEAGEKTARLHTATHLLLAALREVLGPNVYQKGSNITAERLRLDFSHNAKMTEKELEKAKNKVNEIIKANVPVVCEEMNIEEAKKAGAMGVFEEKYHALRQAGGEKVKVYSVGKSAKGGHPFSREICGGPHVQKTGELGHFRIIKEEASSAGVRRIKAILE